MQFELKYEPEKNPQINLSEDLTNCLNQLSDCYNDIIKDLQNKVKCLEIERKSIINALKIDNIKGLKEYFGI